MFQEMDAALYEECERKYREEERLRVRRRAARLLR